MARAVLPQTLRGLSGCWSSLTVHRADGTLRLLRFAPTPGTSSLGYDPESAAETRWTWVTETQVPARSVLAGDPVGRAQSLYRRIEETKAQTHVLWRDFRRLRRDFRRASGPASREQMLERSPYARLLARLETMPVIEQAKGSWDGEPRIVTATGYCSGYDPDSLSAARGAGA